MCQKWNSIVSIFFIPEPVFRPRSGQPGRRRTRRASLYRRRMRSLVLRVLVPFICNADSELQCTTVGTIVQVLHLVWRSPVPYFQ